MYLTILKKDLKRKKTMNMILLLFIILAVTFIASSINNVTAVTTALDSYFEKANVPDYWICATDFKEADKIGQFVKTKKLKLFSQELLQLELEQISVERKEFDYSNTILVSDINNTVTLFDSENREIEHIANGEIYVTAEVFRRCDLKAGDKITLTNSGKSKTFTLKGSTKDAFFASSMVGMTRFVISTDDYKDLTGSDDVRLQSIGIFTDDVEKFIDDLNEADFNSVFSASKSTMKTTYITDIVIAAVVLIVSVCLILISLVILRFTINFTMSEEFREIGVMKAIGIQNHSIRRLYIVKYLAISVAGSAIGLVGSIPFGKMLLSNVSQNIIIPDAGNYVINVLCAASVVGIVLLFGYLCTGRIKKFTPIDAIRNGAKGERFKRKGVLRLSRSKGPAVLFMALNDILSGLRRYGVMVVIFTLGILLIIVPVNTMNTLQSDSLISWFSMAQSDHVLSKEMLLNNDNKNKENVENKLDEIKGKLKEQNIQADVFMEMMFRMNISYNDKKSSSIAFQGVGDVTTDMYSYLEGTAPQNNNEVGISHVVSDRIGAGIGDTVEINLGGETREYIVTVIFQTMNNMGEGIRFYQEENLDYTYAAGSFGIQIKYTDSPSEKTLEERKDTLKQLFPQYKVHTCGGYISQMIGDIAGQMNGIKQLICVVVICINVLVTVLMVKSFITKEKGEIGMLKAVGFANSTLMLWQNMRIGIVLLASLFIGTAVSMPVSKVTAGQVFKLMGAATIEFEVVPFEVYVLYPLMVFVATIFAGFLTSAQLRNISASETSNME